MPEPPAPLDDRPAVTRYCAFLRGVNVNGRKMLMADVRSVAEQAGLRDVTTVLATGNVVFSADEPAPAVARQLGEALSDHYDAPVFLFVKDAAQVDQIVDAVPFEANPDLHVYAFVCDDGFADTLAEEFATVTPVADERATVNQGCFFWQVPKGSTLDAGFSTTLGDRRLRDKFTSRNISTMRKVQAAMSR
ncbi:MAG: DUF1697 domain-containing protein [Micrococcales bacterium]|nr:DUF1697 domain-containing protein [Micrococcales bacterium]